MQLKLALIAIGAAALLGTTVFLMMHKSMNVASFPEAVVHAYKNWCNEYNKCPPNEDIDLQVARLNTFYDNYKKIEQHNRQHSTYTVAINAFMDLTAEEFATTHLTLLEKKNHHYVEMHDSHKRASAVDWRTKGVVTPIKDQGQCGSCWAFSTTGSVEAAYTMNNNPLTSFSEQQLVDCSGSYGNQGCNGGLMDSAFQYIIASSGLATEDEYPYTAEDGQCNAPSTGAVVPITSYKDIPAGDTDSLLSAISQQPVSIAVDANSWQFYSGGIFSDCNENLDHGVLAVGYDADSNYIVKNSWGTSWGVDGYITLAAGNTCGLANAASYPVA